MHTEANCVYRPSASAARCQARRKSRLYPIAVAGLLFHAVALTCAWSEDLIKITTDATIRLPFGFAIPVMREEKTFSFFGSLAEFYDTGQIVIFLTVAVFGILVPIAKFLVSAILVLRSSTLFAAQLVSALHQIGRWAMVDVFALAIVTATLKLGDNLDVEIRPGFYAFLAAALIPMVNGIIIERLLQKRSSIRNSQPHML